MEWASIKAVLFGRGVDGGVQGDPKVSVDDFRIFTPVMSRLVPVTLGQICPEFDGVQHFKAKQHFDFFDQNYRGYRVPLPLLVESGGD